MSRIIGVVFFFFSVMTHADDSLIINASPLDSSFIVTLPANPTTGYQWSVDSFNKTLFTLSSGVYQKPTTKLIGGGGQMVYTFVLNKGCTYPASTNMTFKYARSWDASSASIKSVTINFINPTR